MSAKTDATADDAAFMKEMQLTLPVCGACGLVGAADLCGRARALHAETRGEVRGEASVVDTRRRNVPRKAEPNVVQVIHNRLTAVEEEMTQVQHKLSDFSNQQQRQDLISHEDRTNGDRELKTAERVCKQQRQPIDESNCSVRESSTALENVNPCSPAEVKEEAAEKPTLVHQKLSSGEKMDVTGFETMNAAAFVLQYCRFHRGEQGIVDSSSGEIMRYAQLYNCIQRVSAGLRERGFRAGNAVRVCGRSVPSLRLLVLTLSVWNLLGIVELEDGATDDVGFGDLDGADSDSTNRNPIRNIGAWLVCASVRHIQRQMTRIDWKLEKAIVVVTHTEGGDESENPNYMLYDDLLTTQLNVRPVSFSSVALDTVALRILHVGQDCDKPPGKFTHFQIIESVERSLSSLSAELLGRAGGSQSFLLNALPFNHSACLTLGFLPAIILGVSLLPACLFTSRVSDQDLSKHFGNHEISTMIISPEDLVQLSECRTLRSLQTGALRTVLCAGTPIPTLPRSLKCLAAWKPELCCRRVLSTAGFLGGIFATEDLLEPIRQKSQSLYQELGQPLPNIHCNVKKPKGLQQGSGMYELRIEMPFGLLPESPIESGIFVTVSWESEDTDSPQFNVITVKRENETGENSNQKSLLYPVLPIEELIASHPLVLDVAVLEWMADDNVAQGTATRSEEKSEPRSDSSLIVFVSLTTGARKYCEDSLATIKNFVAKKISSDYATNFHDFLLVDRIYRDAYGRASTEMLERRLAEEYQEGQET